MEIYETLYIGDVVELRKRHPCGSHNWEIVRTGADIGLICQGCGQRILLTRRRFARSAKRFIGRGPDKGESEDQIDAAQTPGSE